MVTKNLKLIATIFGAIAPLLSAPHELKIQLGHSSGVRSVAFSSDGKYALSGSDDKTLKLWKVSSGKEVRTMSGHFRPLHIIQRIINRIYGKKAGMADGHFYGVSSVAFSPDGKHALSGSYDGTIKYWNALTGELIYSAVVTREGGSFAWIPEGFLSGSEKLAREMVYILDGMKVVDTDQLLDAYYRPDIVTAKAGGKT
ncbi:MAG TPA: hypothetical protein PK385_01745 [Spirochaetota bacterium]|nr:hypothetical protein [Spirochaetota bacterium]HOS31573.1 hypothetical protein [Spirochaetota bacterium]HOS54760.1 hypothetical protein [Spirochaetota bacterium]HPK62260.1 hypothetical protein [Spirochaetota bacterium]HQF77438.1 hypothetical protein [Spirochaetota bacterium]